MNPLLVALDVNTAAEAFALADALRGAAGGFKIGSRLFTAQGPATVTRLVERGDRVFLDLKFHDIPSTVAGAVEAAARLGVWMVNVHAAGGTEMMRAAKAAASEGGDKAGTEPPLVVAVTVLTSLGPVELEEIGLAGGPEAAALRLARLSASCGLDGVVCSPLEAPALRRAFGPAFRLVTPGIRPAGVTANDQARILTPEAAVAAGADFLVIGRPITEAADPVAALASINAALGVAA